jgi:integrase
MAHRKFSGSMDKKAEGHLVRKTSKTVVFLNKLADNCYLNTQELIKRGRESSAFGNINWSDASWCVTEAEQQRSHKQRELNLHFTQHRAHSVKKGVGEPFDNSNSFSDIVKALIRLRREIGGQVVTNQNEIIIGFRYIYDELEGLNYDLKMLDASHLDAASKKVSSREAETSAYKRIEKIEEIARLLDENGLVLVPLKWSCSSNNKPASMRGPLLDLPEDQQANQSKLPQDGIIEGIAELYNIIPKGNWADRIRICFVSLLVITGLRIGELLTLPARRVETEDGTGRRYIVYYPEKGAPPQKKWLMTAAGELATEIIDEILQLTHEAREMAKWMFENPGKIKLNGIDLDAELVSGKDLLGAIGIEKNAAQFFKARDIEPEKINNRLFVKSSVLVPALLQESFLGPINIVKDSGQKIYLKDALACVFCNAFHSDKATLPYAVAPISEQHISDFLRSRAGMKAVFERYDIFGPDGEMLEVATHAFRHWLNDLLDRGGLSDVEQAVYFGRRNPKDNRAYHHMTPQERTLKARQDLKDGLLLGPVANIIARLPVDKQDIVLEARVQAVHVVPGGACFHEFSQTPCPNHMACTDGCGDFHWQTNDQVGIKELQYQKSVLEVAVETAKREMDEDSWGADSWLDHNIRKLHQVRQCLTDCGEPVNQENSNG